MTNAKLLFAAGALLPSLAVAQIRIAVNELPLAAKGVYYSFAINTYVDGRCDRGNCSLSLAGGALPKGVDLGAFGLEGVPREMGRFRFTIRAENLCAAASRTLELVVTGKPILDATPDEITFSYHTPEQVPDPKTILVSGTWPNLPYSAEVRNADWLRVKQEQGTTPDPDSALTGDVVTLTVDPSKLEPGTYRGSVTFWTRNGANTPIVPVILVIESPKEGNATAVSTHEAGPAKR